MIIIDSTHSNLGFLTP